MGEASDDAHDVEALLTRAAPDDVIKYLSTLADRIEEKRYARKTLQSYWAQWIKFASWCESVDRNPLPVDVDTLRLYMATLAERVSYRTIIYSLGAIKLVHYTNKQEAPIHHPRIQAFLAALRKHLGTATNHVDGLTPEALQHICRTLLLKPTKMGTRDRALLCVGWAGALRSAELAALHWEDISIEPFGLVVNIAVSKSDQTARGQTVMLPVARKWREICPADALVSWRQLLEAMHGMRPIGPVFTSFGMYGQPLRAQLNSSDVGRVLRRRANAAGITEARYAGHSLRRGWIEAADSQRKSLSAIMTHTRHRSLRSLADYIKPLPWEAHPSLDLY